MKTCYKFPGAENWATIPLMRGGEVFRELVMLEIEDGAKFVIMGGMVVVEGTEYTPMVLEWWRTKPTEGSLQKYLKKVLPARLCEVKYIHGSPLCFVRCLDANKRLALERGAVKVTVEADVLKRERAHIEEYSRRSDRNMMVFLFLGVPILLIGGCFLLFFIWFIGTLFKEVF